MNSQFLFNSQVLKSKMITNMDDDDDDYGDKGVIFCHDFIILKIIFQIRIHLTISFLFYD